MVSAVEKSEINDKDRISLSNLTFFKIIYFISIDIRNNTCMITNDAYF